MIVSDCVFLMHGIQYWFVICKCHLLESNVTIKILYDLLINESIGNGFLQKSHFCQAKIWSGTSLVQETENTQMGQEQTGQHKEGIGRPQEKIGW